MKRKIILSINKTKLTKQNKWESNFILQSRYTENVPKIHGVRSTVNKTDGITVWLN